MRPLLATAAFLAALAALVACGTGEGGPGTPPRYVAAFPLGADTPEARQFVLTPTPGPRVEVLLEPSPAPLRPPPDRGAQPPPEPPPSPDGGWPSFEPSVAWADDGRYLAVVTFGSGSCPSGPRAIEVVADQEIEIAVGPLVGGQDVCSADISGHVTVVALPEGITPTRPLVARFGTREVAIPAVGGG